ncbi:hypothetical protein QVD17_27549 [Tagetes erecta]|uniref:Uncharacterized protein n=1 Tax=Tagetes erecta TaxID=13708 RepID=A0AAD8KF16_TARER|nr:hypothetical protein QVD17_27549 [Tagetes erecta]
MVLLSHVILNLEVSIKGLDVMSSKFLKCVVNLIFCGKRGLKWNVNYYNNRDMRMCVVFGQQLVVIKSKQLHHLLSKQRSWSPDIHRDIEWQKLKNNQQRRYSHRRSKSIDGDAANEVNVTDDDVKELKACFDLGFGFDSCSDFDPKLTQAFPALELYAAVNRQYNSRLLSRSSSICSDSSSTSSSSSTTVIVDPSK